MVVQPGIKFSELESSHQTKDGLIRSLSESQQQGTKKKDEEMINVTSEVEDHENEDLSSRYIHLVSREERIHGNFSDDHGYSKPFNWRPDHPLSRPTKTLFIPRVIRQCNKYLKRNYEDDEIDVVNTDVEKNAFLPGKYDYDKAIKFMKEPERFVSFANTQFCVLPDKEDMEWDEASIPKDNWTSAQTRLFNKAFKILNADRLSHLATEGVLNEPVLRRLSADKTSKRFRLILSEILWDSKLTRWLHETFCEHLPRHHIATYLEVLQSLRAKMPTLVDKMTSGKLPMDISTQLAKEGLQLLIKRPWDPVVTSLGEENIKKLPNNPLLILICKESWTLRSKRWALMLSHLGKLVVLDYSSEDSKKMTVSAYLHHMITQTIAKIRELKRNNPDRSVILLGWGSVASVACQVAAMESVAVIVCLGFPVYTLDGSRGEADDPIMDLKTSILFIVGQNSLLCRSDDIEDMREKMKAETGLIIVGEADDALRVSKIKKCLEGITQSMVDRCLIDEIREFTANVLRAPPMTHSSSASNDSLLNLGYPHSDVNGPPMIPASPLVSCSDGNKSNKKNNPRPRKKSDKPKKPKINKVVYNIPVTTECSNIHGLNKQPLQTTSVKILSPAPTTVTSSMFFSQSQSKLLNPEDIFRTQKMLDSTAEKINKLIELPSTPLKPSEALKHMTNSPTISTAPPIISTSLSLTTTPQFAATIPSSPLISRQVIQHPGIKAAGLKSVASIPHLVCPPSVTHSGKLVTPSPNLIILNQHLDSSKVKCPITIKKPIVCTSNSTVGTPQATISYNPSKELLPTRSLSSLTPGKSKDENFCILAVPASQASLPTNQSPSKFTETIKLVNKYLPKTIGDVPKDKDRRNVAEILASLSSLQPEPNKTLTTLAVTSLRPTTSNATIIQPSPIVSGKYVKVVQKGNEGKLQITSTPTTSPSRFRKQIFVTSDTKASSSIGSSENEGPSSIGRFGSSTLSVDEDTLSSSPKLPLFEADILEEDFEDMEYKPYAKKSKPAIKNKRIK
ncbi:uncharacterized protein Rcd1 isoform X2 [Lepeophtheirus salmonis]|uniref:uncharacterized protein Rcd1 isoform X2 n=1 Tax=Lepeophtheirus salmonis TaxID=72036 RepID=UPI001AEABD39|nr:KAT8 regulatory NSL complex subunit 3-like isoform X2 [Lepeophtheirus salmonis]